MLTDHRTPVRNPEAAEGIYPHTGQGKEKRFNQSVLRILGLQLTALHADFGYREAQNPSQRSGSNILDPNPPVSSPNKLLFFSTQ